MGSYQKIVIFEGMDANGNTILLVLPQTNISPNLENNMESYSEPKQNPSNSDPVNRNILNINNISKQIEQTVTITDDSIKEHNDVGFIDPKGPVPDTSDNYPSISTTKQEEILNSDYPKEVALALLEQLFESNRLVTMKIFDKRAVDPDGDNNNYNDLSGDCSGDDEVCKWPQADHPTYREYTGYIKSMKVEESADETMSRYNIQVAFEVGNELQ